MCSVLNRKLMRNQNSYFVSLSLTSMWRVKHDTLSFQAKFLVHSPAKSIPKFFIQIGSSSVRLVGNVIIAILKPFKPQLTRTAFVNASVAVMSLNNSYNK